MFPKSPREQANVALVICRNKSSDSLMYGILILSLFYYFHLFKLMFSFRFNGEFCWFFSQPLLNR